MRCPFCDAQKESLKVIDSRSCEGGRGVRRRRQCTHCKRRFTTYERVEDPVRLIVVKKDGSRVPFDRTKVLLGLERACFKRPVRNEDLQRLADQVEEDVSRNHDKEVPSALIGQLVAQRLRRLDQVAYVRFASVYRQFRTLHDLVAEAHDVMDTRKGDDIPGQGRLFGEPQADQEPGQDGHPDDNGAPHKHVGKPAARTTKQA